MKKTLILSILFALGLSSPVCSQSFLKKALKKVDQVLDATDELVNGKSATATNTQQIDVQTAQKWTSWYKDNLKGRVKTVTEVRLWDGEKTTSIWKYTSFGMVEEFSGDDGVVNCDYREINGVWYLAHRNITPVQREYPYLEWEGKVYSESDLRAWYPDKSGNMPGTEAAPREDIVYTRMDGGRVLKADITRKGSQTVPSFFVYDESGNLVFEYMENMDSKPIREIRYDTQGRKIYERDPSDMVYEFKYNDHSDIVYRKTSNTFGEDEDSESTFEYRYDDRGNWIEKVWVSGEETIATYKRTIEYYE